MVGFALPHAGDLPAEAAKGEVGGHVAAAIRGDLPDVMLTGDGSGSLVAVDSWAPLGTLMASRVELRSPGLAVSSA